ncbi:MAG: vWA domain-containing protein [Planctomycetota bacterium]|nr:vWA domain-containing protein [Planctomycetota bacterium]
MSLLKTFQRLFWVSPTLRRNNEDVGTTSILSDASDDGVPETLYVESDHVQLPDQCVDRRMRHREVLCLDVSPSMFSSTKGVTRLDVLKRASRGYAQRSATSKSADCECAVISFGGTSAVALPMTTVAEGWLDRVIDNLASCDGTNFAGALDLASQVLVSEGVAPSVRVILLTDGGHNTGGDPVEAAERLKALGVQLRCIGCAEAEADVDMGLLRRMASVGEDGQPLVEFAGTPGELERSFNRIADGLERWPA